MKQGNRRSRHNRHPLYLKFKQEQYEKLLHNFSGILKGQIFLILVMLLIERMWLPSPFSLVVLTTTGLVSLTEFVLAGRGSGEFRARLGILHGGAGFGIAAITISCYYTLAVDGLPQVFGQAQLLGQFLILGFYMLVMGFAFLTSFPIRPWVPVLQALPLMSVAILLGKRQGIDSLAFLSLFFPIFGWVLLALSVASVERLYYREFRIRSLVEQRRRKVTEELDRAERLNSELREIRENLEKEIEERKLVEKNLEQVAAFDELTAVYNRRAGVEVLKEALHYSIRKQSALTIAFVDLDRLKIVNDNFGHEEGDRYLRDVVSLLRKHLRKSDSLSRYGGDEFLAVLPDCSEDEALAIFNRIEEDMSRMNAEERLYPVSFSYGFAEADLQNELDYRRLIAMADDRMYINKQKKRFSGT